MIKLITDFSVGELSSKLSGRVDLPFYNKGSRELVNWVPYIQGGITNRPGLKYIEACNSSTGVRLVPFIISPNLSYILEMAPQKLYIRSVINGQVAASFETGFPYTTMEQINEIQFAQDALTLYFAQKDHPPQKLVKNLNNFSFGPVSFRGNLWEESVTSEAGQSLYKINNPKKWDMISVGDYISSGTQTLFGGETVKIIDKYIDDYGNYIIKANTLASVNTTANATIQKAPFQLEGDYPRCVAIWGGRLWWASTINEPQSIWASSVWEPGDGYEKHEYFETVTTTTLITKPVAWTITGTLTAGSKKITGVSDDDKLTLMKGDRLECSGYIPENTSIDKTEPDILMTAAATSSGGNLVITVYLKDETQAETYYKTISRDVVTDAHAMYFSIASDHPEPISWLASGVHLVIGTAVSEYIVPQGVSALSPMAQMFSRIGSDRIQARMFGNGIIFASSAGKRLYQYIYANENSAYNSPELTFTADHILTGSDGYGIRGFDFSQSFQPMLYCVRSDGVLSVNVYSPYYGIQSWSRWVAADSGKILSIAVAVDYNGEDSVFVAVKRDNSIYIEKFDSITAPKWYLDHYYEDNRSNGITKTIHEFKDKTVYVVYKDDGVYKYYATTANGYGVIDVSQVPNNTDYAVGLAYACLGETNRIIKEQQRQDYIDPGITNPKRVYKALFMLNDSYPFSVSSGGSIWDTVNVSGPYTGDAYADVSGDYNTNVTLSFRQDKPVPTTILAIAVEVV